MITSISDVDILDQAHNWLTAGQVVCLVTVVKTWGSSPRPVGSIMAMSGDGRYRGSVSGGCVEEDLLARFRNGELGEVFPTFVDYGVNTAEAARFGLPCGGRLELLIERLQGEQPLVQLLQAIRSGKPLTRQVCLNTGEVSLHNAIPDRRFEVTTQRCRRVFGPDWTMLLIGAVDLSRYVAQIARTLDYRVIVCDPREQARQNWDMPDTELVQQMPDDTVRHLANLANCVILTLSHDPKLDDMALMEALRSHAAYVGALGSRRSSQARRERLLQLGITSEQIDRLHAPVGLPIGSQTPAEIAVAILAEVTALRHRRQIAVGQTVSAA